MWTPAYRERHHLLHVHTLQHHRPLCRENRRFLLLRASMRPCVRMRARARACRVRACAFGPDQDRFRLSLSLSLSLSRERDLERDRFRGAGDLERDLHTFL